MINTECYYDETSASEMALNSLATVKTVALQFVRDSGLVTCALESLVVPLTVTEV